jgi:hypothetical protein
MREASRAVEYGGAIRRHHDIAFAERRIVGQRIMGREVAVAEAGLVERSALAQSRGQFGIRSSGLRHSVGNVVRSPRFEVNSGIRIRAETAANCLVASLASAARDGKVGAVT